MKGKTAGAGAEQHGRFFVVFLFFRSKDHGSMYFLECFSKLSHLYLGKDDWSWDLASARDGRMKVGVLPAFAPALGISELVPFTKLFNKSR